VSTRATHHAGKRDGGAQVLRGELDGYHHNSHHTSYCCSTWRRLLRTRTLVLKNLYKSWIFPRAAELRKEYKKFGASKQQGSRSRLKSKARTSGAHFFSLNTRAPDIRDIILMDQSSSYIEFIHVHAGNGFRTASHWPLGHSNDRRHASVSRGVSIIHRHEVVEVKGPVAA
jgi:hypothetical protein